MGLYVKDFRKLPIKIYTSYKSVADPGLGKAEEQQQHHISDDPTPNAASGSSIGKKISNDDDVKASYTLDATVC